MENEENVISTPTPEVQERLWVNRDNPDVINGYNSLYGPGSAETYLGTRAGTPPSGDDRVIPEGAIERLRSMQGTDQEAVYTYAFNNLYGAGSAQSVLNPITQQPEGTDRDQLSFLGRLWDATGEAVIGGAFDAASNTLQTADDLGNLINPLIGDLVRTESGWQYMRGDELRQWYAENDGGSVADLLSATIDGAAPETSTGTGNVVRGFSTFLVPYLGSARALNVGHSLLRGTALGAAVDFTVWDPDDPNLSAMAVQLGLPNNFITDLMATDPDDPDMVNRLRNAGEGAILGTVFDGLLRVHAFVRAGRAAQEAGDTAGVQAAQEGIRETVAELDQAVAAQTGDAVQGAREAAEQTREAITPPETPAPEAEAPEAAPTVTEAPASNPPSGFRLSPEEIDNINSMAENFAQNPLEAFSRTLPWRSPATFNGYDDVAANFAATRQVLSERFNDIAGGSPQTFEEVQRMASARLNEMAALVGRDPQELLQEWGTFGRPWNELAADILARDNLLLAYERDIREIAAQINQNALDTSRYKNLQEARADLQYRRELVANLLSQQAAARTNIGRALNAMKVARGGDQRLQDLIKGGLDSTDIDSFARAVDEDKATRPTEQMNRMSGAQQVMDRISNYRINALLSGPGTQEVNAISSAINTFMTPLRTILGGEFRHGLRQVRGMVSGAFDAMRSAKRAFIEDSGILDPGNTKFDGEDLAKGDKGLVQSTISLPSRLLLTMDELFKQSMYRGWITADAAASADAAGLRGQARRAHIQQYIRDSYTPDGQANGLTRADALMMSQRATFTEPLRPGSFAAQAQKGLLVGEGPGKFIARTIVPFFRTPVNILKQSFQHMPIINRLSQELREDMAAGGARAAQARAKVYLGWATTAAGVYYAMSGRITGSGPSDPLVNAEWRAAGNQPYSIRFTDDDGQVMWVSYQRLEPIANVLSTIADAVEIIKNPYNEDQQGSASILGGIALALAENSVNKTFTAGISDFFDIMQGERNAQSALYNFAGSFIPNLLNQANTDDAFRDIRSFMDVLDARTWGFENVAPRRNLLGEVILRPSSKMDPLGWFTGRGFQDVDPVLQEMSRVSIADRSAFQPPSHSVRIDGERTSLKDIRHSVTNRPLYDMWMERTGTIEIRGRTLREALGELMASNRYQDAPEGAQGVSVSGVTTKGRLISQVITEYRNAARADIPELVEVLRRSEEEGMELLRGQYNANRNRVDRFGSLSPITNN